MHVNMNVKCVAIRVFRSAVQSLLFGMCHFSFQVSCFSWMSSWRMEVGRKYEIASLWREDEVTSRHDWLCGW
jgi:hypothetical protein